MELIDLDGKKIRLSDERQSHILEHAELAGHLDWIRECLSKPERIILSNSDENARLYYRYYFGTRVGDKWLCVVVKFDELDAFVVTAYLTDKLKQGVQLWPKP